MNKELRWKIGLIVGLVVLFAVLAYPLDERIKLGLDLSGGIHLDLQVDTEGAVVAEVRDDLDGYIRVLEDEEILLAGHAADGSVGSSVVLGLQADLDRAIALATEFFPTYDVDSQGSETVTLTLRDSERAAVVDRAVNQALQTIRNRIDEYGVEEPVIQRQGVGTSRDRILVQLPGVENPERVKQLLKNTAVLELKLVESGPLPSRQALLELEGGETPPGMEIVVQPPDDQLLDGLGGQFYLVSSDPVIRGSDLKTARLSQDDMGLPAVSFSLTPDGSRKFGETTGANIGKLLAIVLDGRVQSAPVIESRIVNSGIIRGSFNIEEAEDVALVLRAGALPAAIEYLEERTVGPSLGRESIRRGVTAAVVGMAIVVVFMLVYYRGAGINAVVALGLNLLVLLGVMAALEARLTLPGIAGVILLIGMAVDANVLIFERIREELDLGKTVRSAIDSGFSKALSAILDANITTLVAALFLFQFGTGPVKGFAITLTIGILASMFTAVFVSRVLFTLSTRRRATTLSI